MVGNLWRARALAAAGMLVGVMWLGLVSASAAAASPLTWSAPVQIDHAYAFGHPSAFDGVSCPSVSLCVAVDDRGAVASSTDPAGGPGAWRLDAVASGLGGVSCPSASLCVAYTTSGNIVSSTNPAGGRPAWNTAQLGASGYLSGLSCPSASLCVTYGARKVFVSTDPGGGNAAWHRAAVDSSGPIVGLSCPSASLCVGSDGGGNVITSTDPASGTWKITRIEPRAVGVPALGPMSCPSASLCVAADWYGNVVTSTNPAGGPGAWSLTHLGYLNSLSCPSASLCVALDLKGDVLTSNDPAGGASTWTRSYVGSGLNTLACVSVTRCFGFGSNGGDVWNSSNPSGGASAWTVTRNVDPPRCGGGMCLPSYPILACPSESLCVMVDHFGGVYVSTAPVGSGASWLPVLSDGADTLQSLSCPLRSLCVALDDYGRLLTSRNPAGPASAWAISRQTGYGGTLSCASSSLCIDVPFYLYRPLSIVFTSIRPAGGAHAWRQRQILRPFKSPVFFPRDVACPSRTLCVIGGNSGVLTSADPTGGSRRWKLIQLDGGAGAVSCPSVKLCVVAGDTGNIASSANPTGGRHAWKVRHVDTASASSGGSAQLSALSCPTIRLCVALDSEGNVLTSTRPTEGRHAWRTSHLKSRFGLGPLAVLTTTSPTRGAAAWIPTAVDPSRSIYSLSCPNRSLCIAGDDSGNILVARAKRPRRW
jgi:hypothetical protein